MRAVSFHPAILSLAGPLTVRAVFDRAWHLHDGSGTVVTVTAAPYDGPMAVRVEGHLGPVIRPGTGGQMAGRVLTVGSVRLDLRGAREWYGNGGLERAVDPEALKRDLRTVHALAGLPMPELSRRMESLYAALLEGEGVAIHKGVRALIGLGPGLTPAGDDVLCGLLVGLHVLALRRW